MKDDQSWIVRLERQPHRDAVRRLRKAYGLVWQLSLSTSTAAAAHEPVAETTPPVVQEVQK